MELEVRRILVDIAFFGVLYELSDKSVTDSSVCSNEFWNAVGVKIFLALSDEWGDAGKITKHGGFDTDLEVLSTEGSCFWLDLDTILTLVDLESVTDA